MSRFNTGNPLGSGSPLDLDDNAKNFDEAINTEDPNWVDRFGRFRMPVMEQERQFVAGQAQRDDQFQSAQSSREAVFSDFLQASGYQDLGEYAPGIEITAHNQYVEYGGQPYALKPSVPVPYTTSGAWTGDDFKLIGDDALRQDLANPNKGSAIVAHDAAQDDFPLNTVGRYLSDSIHWVSPLNFKELVTDRPDPEDKTTWDWWPAIQAALDSSLRVIIPSFIHEVTKTLYYRPKHIILAASGASGVRLRRGVVANMFYPAGPFGTEAAPNDYAVDGVKVLGLTIDHNRLLASEFVESIMTFVALSATNLTISGCTFMNPSGDCIYISNKYGSEKSSVIPYNVRVLDNDFVGSNINRNAISVITGRKIRIIGNDYLKITRPGMPCPIDLEPNNVGEIIEDVIIRDNTFDGCRGGISTYLTSTASSDAIRGVIVDSNIFTNPYTLDTDALGSVADIVMANVRDSKVTGNSMKGSARLGILLQNATGLTVTNNTVDGPKEAGISVIDISDSKVDDNKITLEQDSILIGGVESGCIGVKATTRGFVSATNKSFVGGSLRNNTIKQRAAPVNSVGISLEGNVTNIDMDGDVTGFSRGLYLGRKAEAYPSNLRNRVDLSRNGIPIAQFTGASIPQNRSWDCGEGVSWGIGVFLGGQSVNLLGKHVFPTSILTVERVGTEGAGNSLSITSPAAGQITVFSTAPEVGEFLWRIVRP